MKRLGWVVVVLLCVVGWVVPASAQRYHTADQDKDNLISLTELLRLIQFFNSDAYHCQAGTEDGYEPGPGAQDCANHDSDYMQQNFIISLSELLRLIQLYNGAYYTCDGGEDGFCFKKKVSPKPNLVLIVCDTLRDDRISKTRNGVPVMPFLSQMASEGTRFTRAYSPGGWTLPGMSGLFSGQYAEHFGAISTPSGLTQGVYFSLDPGVEPLAEWLGLKGYDNWGVEANGYVSPLFGLDQGFATGRYNLLQNNPAAPVTNGVLATKDQWTEPFLVFAQYLDPHAPYYPPTEYTNIFGTQPTLTGTDSVYLSPAYWPTWASDDVSAYFDKAPRATGPLSANGIDVLQYRYDADCRYMDDEIKRMVEAIEAQYPNTIFVVVADHGDALMEREVHGHGHTVYEETARVPFIIKGPGVPVQEITRRVNTISVLPTLAGLIKESPRLEWEGVDALVHTGEAPEYSFTWSNKDDVYIKSACVADGDLKLIIDSHFDDAPQLYDLSADPNELANLASSRPDDVTRLKALLDAHEAAVSAK